MALTADEIAVGKRIFLARKEYGVTRRAAAARMWLSYHQLNRIERGEVATPFLPALLFCEFADLNPLWLAFGERESKFGFFIFQGADLQKDLKEHPSATFFEILWRHRWDFGAAGSGRYTQLPQERIARNITHISIAVPGRASSQREQRRRNIRGAASDRAQHRLRDGEGNWLVA